MNYWQIRCGSFGRDYAQEFLRYGMAFVFIGFNDVIDALEVGDRVIMKRGMTEVVAVGEVVQREGKHKGNAQEDGDSRHWLRDFDGWDLASYCFVQWHVPKKPIRTEGLTRATIQNVYTDHLRDLAERVLTTSPAQQTLEPEPSPTQPVSDDEILNFLIRQGLRPGAAEDLTATLTRIRRLARYYYDGAGGRWEDIREHETRTFLVIPLLLALGWAEQQVKIELPIKGRQRADLACFSSRYTGENEDCALILESKGFSQGLEYAPDQAKTYAKHFPSCRTVVVSNGYCYKTYRRAGSQEFAEKPSAYLNLLSPRDRYPRDPGNVDGALEALRSLLPVCCR